MSNWMPSESNVMMRLTRGMMQVTKMTADGIEDLRKCCGGHGYLLNSVGDKDEVTNPKLRALPCWRWTTCGRRRQRVISWS